MELLSFYFNYLHLLNIKGLRIWIGKTGVYIKLGGNGRKGRTIIYQQH